MARVRKKKRKIKIVPVDLMVGLGEVGGVWVLRDHGAVRRLVRTVYAHVGTGILNVMIV